MIRIFLLLLFFVLSFSKETFVLIHAASAGAWSWYKVKNILESKGHDVIVFDLPSLGIDNTDAATIELKDHVDAVLAVLNSLTEPAIVVGHAFGGLLLSLASDLRPQKVKKAVFVTAAMLQDGESVFSALQRNTESESSMGNGIITTDSAGNPLTFKMDLNLPKIKEVVCADCTDEDMTLCKLLTKPHPISTFMTPINIGAGFDSVNKVYISALQDKAFTPGFQKEMYSKFPGTKVYTIQASHMVVLSKPAELVDILNEIVGIQKSYSDLC